MFNNMTPVVKQLLIINVIVFILSQVMPQNYDTLYPCFISKVKISDFGNLLRICLCMLV